LVAGFDFHGAVSAGSADEFLDAPTGLGLNVMTDGHRRDDNAQVGFDGLAHVVIDRAGLQVVLRHPKAFLMCQSW
jgi:hypothetical protein